MNMLLSRIDGYKTYIGVLVGAVYAVLINLGWATSDEWIWTAIATWTGISFRQAINK